MSKVNPFDAGCPSQTPQRVSRFAANDPYVTLWVKFAGVSAGDTIRVQFVDPTGQFDRYETTFKFDKAGVNTYCTSRMTDPIVRGGPRSGVQMGDWTVKVYLNGRPEPLFPPLTFTVSPPAYDPNLVATLTYMANVLNSQGQNFSEDVWNADGEPSTCVLSYWLVEHSDSTSTRTNVPLKSVQKANVTPQNSVPMIYLVSLELAGELADTWHYLGDPRGQLQSGHNRSAKRTQSMLVSLKFGDEETANNFAKSIVAAVDLCSAQDQKGGAN